MKNLPLADENRIRIIDAIRGVAILGILLMNVNVAGHYWEPSFFQKMIDDYTSADFISTITIQALFEGKMRALFCMLFGAGILLFLKNKAKTNGENLWALHFKRMCWLLVFGLFNGYLLLFKYDILFMYAVSGVILYFLRNMRIRYKLLAMPLIILIGFVDSNMSYKEEREKFLAQTQEVQLDSSDTDSTALTDKSSMRLAAEERLMKGSYLDVASVIYPKVFAGQTKEFISRITDNVPLMLLGMALFQLGFFTGQWHVKRYQQTLVIGYLLGIPLVSYDWYYLVEITNKEEAMAEIYRTHSFTFTFLVYHSQRILLALGHVALITLIYKKGWLKSVFRRLEAVGQMALTNYLMQSMFLAIIFYGFGFGLFNALSYYLLYFIVLAIWIIQVGYSPIWLQKYRFGPFEWFWRTITYWKIQKMSR